MLAIVRDRSGFQEKPDYFVRGDSARLPWAWDSLCFALPAHEATNDGFRDYANNQAALTFTGAVWERDNRGNQTVFMDGSSYTEFSDHPRHDAASSEVTVHVRIKYLGPGVASGNAVIIQNYYASVAPYNSWGLYGDAGTLGKIKASIYTTTEGGVPREIVDTYVMGTTEYTSVFLRWRSGETMKLDLFGERGNPLSSSVSGSVMNGTIPYAAGTGILLNADTGNVDNFQARYSQVMAWSRCLTDVEMLALVADPFGWYSPRRETVTVAAPFPIGPGYGTPGMLMIR